MRPTFATTYSSDASDRLICSVTIGDVIEQLVDKARGEGGDEELAQWLREQGADALAYALDVRAGIEVGQAREITQAGREDAALRGEQVDWWTERLEQLVREARIEYLECPQATGREFDPNLANVAAAEERPQEPTAVGDLAAEEAVKP